jgi:dTMP kinase
VARGFFLSFEGGEGCGKSTQIVRLHRRLTELGRECVVTREPGGTEIGERVRHLLQHDPAGAAMVPEAELLLFAASRAQLAREVIGPALAAGKIVLADRYLDSTTVYQGVGRALPSEAVAAINAFAVGSALPDRTLLLDVDPAVARGRMARRGAEEDRMESLGAAFHAAVRSGYLALAAREPARVRVIDAGRGADEVEARVWAEVEPELGRGV